MKKLLISALIISFTPLCFSGSKAKKAQQYSREKQQRINKLTKENSKLKNQLVTKEQEKNKLAEGYKENQEKNENYQQTIVTENNDLLATIAVLKAKIEEQDSNIQSIGYMLDEKTKETQDFKQKLSALKKYWKQQITDQKNNHENILNNMKTIALGLEATLKTKESTINTHQENETKQKLKIASLEQKIKQYKKSLKDEKRNQYNMLKTILEVTGPIKTKNEPAERNWLGSTINSAARAMKIGFVKDIKTIEEKINEQQKNINLSFLQK